MRKEVLCLAVCLAVSSLMLAGMAGATPTVAWFPYANCHNWPSAGGTTWGAYWGTEVAPAGDLFHKFPVYGCDVNGSWDTNSDNKISYAEAYAGLPGLPQSEFNKVDTDGDGFISREDTKLLHNPNPDLNPIWNTYRIWNNYSSIPTPYAPSATSTYDAGYQSQYTWVLALHNPTTTNFTGASALRVDVYAPNGDHVTDDTTKGNNHWYYDTANPMLLNTAAGGNTTYNTTNDCFYVNVSAGATVVLACWGAANTNSLFTDPSVGAPTADLLYKATVKVSQADGYDFMASIRGLNVGKYRFSPTVLSWDKIGGGTFSYSGIYEGEFPSSTSNTVVLPHYRERYDDANNAAVSEWATFVSLVNATDSADVVTISVKDLTGATTYSMQYGLKARQHVVFIPSQFWPAYSPASQIIDAQGSIEITGKRPVATALHMRFPKTSWSTTTTKVTGGTLPNPTYTTLSQYFRTTSLESADLFVK